MSKADCGSSDMPFLRSELALEGRHTLDEFFEWYRERLASGTFQVRRVPFAELDKWAFRGDPLRLSHDSGKFFSVEGVEVTTSFGAVPRWEQPIINQPEIGILGILTKEFDGVLHFLMQAKMEPGNINTLQISPTVQATKSNYTQVHKGNVPTYLEYFVGSGNTRILVDQLQSEQGARFLAKRNRNMIIETREDVEPHPDFIWLTLGQIKKILAHDNIMNMDARTVLSCVPYFTDRDIYCYDSVERHVLEEINGYSRKLIESMSRQPELTDFDRIISWLTTLKCGVEMSVRRKPVDRLEGWRLTGDSLAHESGRYFSVIGVEVRAGNREVISWSQPLLEHFGVGLCGFLTQMQDGVLQFLVSARVEPGNRDIVEFGPTVARSGVPDGVAPAPVPLAEYFSAGEDVEVVFDAVHSEEGGRFYHFRNRYMVVEAKPGVDVDVPDGCMWMTLAQISRLIKFSLFNVEARNLFACLDLNMRT
ncbi:MAG: NDP-hexose 2,3-dehydratase family protein [Desulfovibrionaceae bacterium]|nr:NDP-hexose 2,3-dehydratase family protein [Desulfovibrionaceae bacterium]